MQAVLAFVLIVAAVANAGVVVAPAPALLAHPAPIAVAHPVAVPVATSSVYSNRAPVAKVIAPVAVAHAVHAPIVHAAPAPVLVG